MERSTRFLTITGILVIFITLLAGCSDNPGPSVTEVTVTTAPVPQLEAGDIVRSEKGAESPAWLVIGYDPAADTYTRALIYKNDDGSFGYRQDSRTETSIRANMERVYTVKIAHVEVDAVPTGAPVTVAATTETASAVTATATATATKTTSSAKPSVKKTDPEEGEAGTDIVMEVTGSDFESNLTVKLRRSGETGITASDVVWYSSTSVTCTFELPNTTRVGTWDIVITNPNGQSGELTNYFMIRGNESVTASGD